MAQSNRTSVLIKGEMWAQASQEECRVTRHRKDEAWNRSFLSASGETSPAGTLISDF